MSARTSLSLNLQSSSLSNVCNSDIPPPSPVTEAAFSSFASPTSPTGRKSSHIRACVRIRPLLKEEHGCTESIDPICDDENYEPTTPNASKKAATRCSTKRSKSLIVGGASGKQFDFDAVFDRCAPQKEVFERTVGDAVRRNIFLGFNTTILAYGATGSGKTYTMGSSFFNDEAQEGPVRSPVNHDMPRSPLAWTPTSGGTPRSRRRRSSTLLQRTKSGKEILSGLASRTKPLRKASNSAFHYLGEDEGIAPRAVQDLFRAKEKHDGNVSVGLTYLELYNDEIRDLLSDEPSSQGGRVDLRLKDNGEDGFIARGLTRVDVNSPAEVMELMQVASRRRTVGATLMNASSSRSHAICVLHVTISPPTIKGSSVDIGETITAKLTLVDLAGSERIKQTGAEGVQQHESININKDLFCLGKVVSALAEKTNKKKADIYVPYRDSKLTMLLRDALGGNSCTVMVACISPSTDNVEESVNTLRYALRVRAITNSAVQNVVSSCQSPTFSAAVLRENKLLKARLDKILGSPMPNKGNENTGDGDDFSRENFVKLQHQCKTLKERLHAFEDQAAISEKQILDASEDVNNWKKKVVIETEAGHSSTSGKNNEDVVSSPSCKPQTETAISPVPIADEEGLHSTDMPLLQSSLKENVANLTKRLEALKFEEHTLEAKLEEKRKNAEAEEAEQSAIWEDVENVLLQRKIDMEGDITNKLAQRDCIEDQTVAAKVQLESLLAESERVISKMNERKKQEETLVANVDTLTGEISDIKSSLESLSFKGDKLRKEIQTLTAERESLMVEVEGHQQVAEVVSQLAEEQEARQRFQTEVKILKKAQNALEEERDNLTKKISEHESRVSQFDEERAKRVRAERECQELRDKIAVLTRDGGVSNCNAIGKSRSPLQRTPSPERRLPPRPRPGHSDASISSSQAHGQLTPKAKTARRTPDDGSVESDQRQIRIDAAKVLFKASKTMSRNKSCGNAAGSDSSASGSTDRTKATRNASVVSASASTRGANSKGSQKVKTTPPMRKGGDDCSCSMSVLSHRDPVHVEFFLPKLDFSCQCDDCRQSLEHVQDPSALRHILRDWQVEFLSSLGITTIEQLLRANKKDSSRLNKAMMKWRKDRKMKIVKKKSCQIALHIWCRTAKIARNTMRSSSASASANFTLPTLQEISFNSDAGSVSTLGCSVIGPDELEI